MDKLIRLLIVEDNPDDAVLVTRALERGGMKLEWRRVETAEAMYQALKQEQYDLIIADYRLPHFSAPEAIKLRDRLAPELPLIIVSGTIGEELAADAMVAGAQDYVMKNNLTRLEAAAERELREAAVRRKRREAEAALNRTREQYANLIENTHDLVQSIDGSGKLLFVNKAWLTTLGYSPAEVAGLNIADFVHPDSLAKCHSIMALVKSGVHPRGFEIKLRTKQGEDIIAEGNTVGYFVDGVFASTLTIFHDITARKRHEDRISHLNQVLGIIRDINQLIVGENDEKSLLQKACDRMVFPGSDYGAAWISLADGNGNMALATAAGVSFENSGCVARVMEIPDLMQKSIVSHRCHLERFSAALSLPLTIESQPIGILNACFHSAPTISDEERALMLELAGDLALGIEKIRKREELGRRNEFIETILDRLPIGLAVNRMNDGSTVYINPMFEMVYGWPRQEISGVADFFQKVYPDPEYRRQIQERVMADIASGDPARMRWENIMITTQTGEKRFISAANIPLSEQGLMISTAWDVTERLKAQEEVALKAQLLDSASDSIFLIEPGGRILYANEEAYKSRGYTREEILGLNITEFRTPDIAELYKDQVEQVLRDGETVFEATHHRKDGTVFQVEAKAKKITSGGRTLTLAVARDVTERRRMENQLVVTDRLASIGELASGIAHELNNPLTGIIGFAELLKGKELPADVADDVDVIYREAMRCAEIIRNLLTFARQHQPERQSLNINNVVEKVLDLRAYEQRVNNINVTRRLDDALPAIHADFFSLQQCFLNIVINAEYFMSKAHSGGNLTVATELAGGFIRITFTDDGPGIPPEIIDRLFDPFFTTKEVGKGTGLGLSICHGLIQSHGGTIRAENAPGGGASFIIDLPLEPPAKESGVEVTQV
ncbi:PAS domain S-box protein [Dehalogenimonas alkenigignens]|uniref:histidine kinase n=1 Tax=Dehalogenimonas alkenigignens TaxID=1217799 RepID=A0A0W0GHB2_9CHLR|nr:PAS domain S-box protein [Dehalogenimonas alkenigignens]KTB47955.1 PAS domain S-box [Dehalogenimonas alkenigignens]PVV83219.1 PAS domain S-box protein [Dehalogenimonas alkenigignens]